VYIVDIEGGAAPKELTSGKQGSLSTISDIHRAMLNISIAGATHHPTLSSRGDKAAWLELDEDGYESDRCVRPPR
jgi:hypothetical protein